MWSNTIKNTQDTLKCSMTSCISGVNTKNTVDFYGIGFRFNVLHKQMVRVFEVINVGAVIFIVVS